ncbi:MAG TPA: alpha/beta fold hydrolase [Xanthobacteraceae bacterium]|nr:alpha/beta fold hydrolase [Xanthobacteraceae bacterium]
MATPSLPSIAFLWPALLAASVSDAASAMANEFAHLAGTDAEPAPPAPRWASANEIALELATMRLRDFSRGAAGATTLVCAPFALHGSTIADFATEHSLVAALRAAGRGRLFVTEWRSAAPEARFNSIDTYLAELNVATDALGEPVDLIGLCQGGWMALLFAARFPAKVKRLVLAGAPVDIAAGASLLSRITDSLPMSAFRDVVHAGDGRVLGRRVLGMWGPLQLGANDIADILQVAPEALAAHGHRLQARFEEWYAWTVDLPGTYYLQVVEWLYKQNRLAAGRFTALGRRIDLSALRTPIYLLAARDDELVAPDQVFATARRVGTPSEHVRTVTAPCRHLGLFMGATTLRAVWPEIVRWLDERRI